MAGTEHQLAIPRPMATLAVNAREIIGRFSYVRDGRTPEAALRVAMQAVLSSAQYNDIEALRVGAHDETYHLAPGEGQELVDRLMESCETSYQQTVGIQKRGAEANLAVEQAIAEIRSHGLRSAEVSTRKVRLCAERLANTRVLVDAYAEGDVAKKTRMLVEAASQLETVAARTRAAKRVTELERARLYFAIVADGLALPDDYDRAIWLTSLGMVTDAIVAR